MGDVCTNITNRAKVDGYGDKKECEEEEEKGEEEDGRGDKML